MAARARWDQRRRRRRSSSAARSSVSVSMNSSLNVGCMTRLLSCGWILGAGPGPAGYRAGTGNGGDHSPGLSRGVLLRAYGRMPLARWVMQLTTALRLPALAMQLSKVVKTLVLRATSTPKLMVNATATASAKTPHTIPATAPELAVPLLRARVTATPPRTAAARPPSRPRGNKVKDTAATRLATPRTRAATPRPVPARAGAGG